MTAITLLGGAFELLLDDEKNQNGGTLAVAGMRAIVIGPSPAVTTTRALYSAIADVTDDVIAMGFQNPMLPTTPNAYTIENKYFIQRRAIEQLKEGAVTSNMTVVAGEGVYRVPYQLAGTAVAPIDSDIGKNIVSGDGDSGTLLDFETEPDGTTVLWIRPDTASDLFDATTIDSLNATADAGDFTVDGAANGTYTAATNGQSTYAAIQAIGSVPTSTEVYLYQNRVKMSDYTGGFQWWATDPALNLGIISILVRTENAGVTLADGDVEVFARRYTSLYDNFRLNVAAGGFSALPLASAPDINNTTGYFDGVWSGGTGTAMLIGDIQSNTTALKTDGKYVVTAVADSGATGTFTWYEIGDLTPFAASDTFTGTNRDGTINGAPTAAVGGPTEAGAGNGGTVTLTAGTFDVDHTGDGVTEPYSIEVDAQGDVSIAKVYEVLKYKTRRGATAADLFGTAATIPVEGERYRGIEAIFQYDAATGTLGANENLLTLTGGNPWTATLVNQNSTHADTYITVMDQQTSLDSIINDNVIDDEGANDITVTSAGNIGIASITSPKSSPLGTFTGTQIFGARGVAFINPASTDTQAYILTDDLGTLNQPPNTITLTVANTEATDRILAARQTGVAGVINKDQYGGLTTPAGNFNGLADMQIEVVGPTAAGDDIPLTGTIRVVDNVNKQEHLYWYKSRTLDTPGVFTLRDVVAGGASTATAGTSDIQLSDSVGGFQTTNFAEVGMLIRNTTNGSDVYEVTAVTNDTTLVIKKLYGSGDAFVSTDGYTINALIGNHVTPGDYLATDDVYLTYIDETATGSTVNQTFIKTEASNFTLVVNVRQGGVGGILPFTLNQLQQDNSVTVTTVRTPDTIAQ
jgi:hypothetical protein